MAISQVWVSSPERILSLAAAALAWLAVGGCSSGSSAPAGTSTSSSGSFSGRTPEHHREVAEECTSERPASNAGEPGAPCVADADCTQGANGRCIFPFTDPAPSCSYDECAADADCGGAQVCNCRNPARFNANTCFHGNCQLDVDCGAGGFCSPSAVTVFSNCTRTIPPGSFGYFCHTPSDECLDDADCPGPSVTACIFSVEEVRWVCNDLACTN
jgi:hypothetical protein